MSLRRKSALPNPLARASTAPPTAAPHTHIAGANSVPAANGGAPPANAASPTNASPPTYTAPPTNTAAAHRTAAHSTPTHNPAPNNPAANRVAPPNSGGPPTIAPSPTNASPRNTPRTNASRPTSSTPAIRWSMWAVGTLLSLATIHGRWDIPIAAWLFGLFLLRFTRTSRVWVGLIGCWVTMAIGVAVMLAESGLPVFSPLLLGFLPLGCVPVLAYLIDRLAAHRIRSPLLGTLVFPSAVVTIEFLVATFTPMGSALTSLVATQHEALPLLQLASVTGGYGISFLMAWLASVGNWAWQQRFAWASIRTTVLTYTAILALVLTAGAIRMAGSPTGDTVRVAGVTWSRSADDALDSMLNTYTSLDDAASADPAKVRDAFHLVSDDLISSTKREAAAGAKIVVWPEAAALVLDADRADLLNQLASVVRQAKIYLIAGLNVVTGPNENYRNEAVLLDPAGRTVWTYEKSRPVPGLDQLDPGDGRVPTTDTPFGRLANVICFDADFPALMRQAGEVDLMLVPSNDWVEFGRTHTEKATVRAIENGYTLVRQDSNGLSRTVDPYGRTIAEADFFVTDQQTMVAFAPKQGVRTIYNTVGDVFAWLCISMLAALTLVAGVYRRMGSAVTPWPTARHA